MPIIDIPFGIDLGTTFSCSAFYNSTENNVEVIQSGTGSREVPSIVSFNKETDDIKVGEAANSCQIKKYSKVYDSKRFIGKKCRQVEKEGMVDYPFNILLDEKDGVPQYEVTRKGNTEYYTPIEISCEVLKHIKKYSLPKIFTKVIDENNIPCVITVPADFNNAQRNATKEAADEAGLKVLALINEPSAAALAYICTSATAMKEKECNILVYDFGGGTFDVSVIRKDEYDVKVISTFGDNQLGGQDITDRLVKHFVEKCKLDRSDEKLMSRVIKKCDELKKSLSVTIENEFDVGEISEFITRTEFNEICKDLFKRTIDIVNQTLNYGKLKPADINYIVLVGGSSRIPKVKELINETFPGIKICSDINPDEAVAVGAAYYARLLLNPEQVKYTVHDVLTHTIGYETQSRMQKQIMEPVLNKMTPLPSTQRKNVRIRPNTNEVTLKIFQGEDPSTTKNQFLGSLLIEVPRNIPSIDIEFSVDGNGCLTAKAFINDEVRELEIVL